MSNLQKVIEYFRGQYAEDYPDAEAELDRLQALADLVEEVGEASIRKVQSGEWVFTAVDFIKESLGDAYRRHRQALDEILPKWQHDKALAALVPGLAIALWVLSNHVEEGLPHGPDEEAEVERTCFLMECASLLERCNTLNPCVVMGHYGDKDSIARFQKGKTLAHARAKMEETTDDT